LRRVLQRGRIAGGILSISAQNVLLAVSCISTPMAASLRVYLAIHCHTGAGESELSGDNGVAIAWEFDLIIYHISPIAYLR
jgi:hypothetical protein